MWGDIIPESIELVFWHCLETTIFHSNVKQSNELPFHNRVTKNLEKIIVLKIFITLKWNGSLFTATVNELILIYNRELLLEKIFVKNGKVIFLSWRYKRGFSRIISCPSINFDTYGVSSNKRWTSNKSRTFPHTFRTRAALKKAPPSDKRYTSKWL